MCGILPLYWLIFTPKKKQKSQKMTVPPQTLMIVDAMFNSSVMKIGR